MLQWWPSNLLALLPCLFMHCNALSLGQDKLRFQFIMLVVAHYT